MGYYTKGGRWIPSSYEEEEQGEPEDEFWLEPDEQRPAAKPGVTTAGGRQIPTSYEEEQAGPIHQVGRPGSRPGRDTIYGPAPAAAAPAGPQAPGVSPWGAPPVGAGTRWLPGLEPGGGPGVPSGEGAGEGRGGSWRGPGNVLARGLPARGVPGEPYGAFLPTIMRDQQQDPASLAQLPGQMLRGMTDDFTGLRPPTTTLGGRVIPDTPWTGPPPPPPPTPGMTAFHQLLGKPMGELLESQLNIWGAPWGDIAGIPDRIAEIEPPPVADSQRAGDTLGVDIADLLAGAPYGRGADVLAGMRYVQDIGRAIGFNPASQFVQRAIEAPIDLALRIADMMVVGTEAAITRGVWELDTIQNPAAFDYPLSYVGHSHAWAMREEFPEVPKEDMDRYLWEASRIGASGFPALVETVRRMVRGEQPETVRQGSREIVRPIRTAAMMDGLFVDENRDWLFENMPEGSPARLPEPMRQAIQQDREADTWFRYDVERRMRAGDVTMAEAELAAAETLMNEGIPGEVEPTREFIWRVAIDPLNFASGTSARNARHLRNAVDDVVRAVDQPAMDLLQATRGRGFWNWLGELRPDGKQNQLISEVMDFTRYLTAGLSDSDDTMRSLYALTDIASPQSDEIARGLSTLDELNFGPMVVGEDLGHMLGLTTGSVIDIGQSSRAKRVGATLRLAFADEEGIFNVTRFADTLRTATPEDATFLMLDRVVGAANDLYPTQRIRGLSNAVDVNNRIKGFMAVYEHMGYVPGFPVRNGLSSVVIGAIDGFAPLNRPATMSDWWQRLGGPPTAATRGLSGGPAGQFLDVSDKWAAAQELAEPGTMARIREVAATAGEGPMLTVSGMVEQGFNAQATYHHARTARETMWQIGGMIPEAAQARLQGRTNDEIVDWVTSRALNAMNAAELDDIADAFRAREGVVDLWREIAPDQMVRLRGVGLSDTMVSLLDDATDLDAAEGMARRVVNGLWARADEIGDAALPMGSHAAGQSAVMAEVIETVGGFEALPRGVWNRLRKEAGDGVIARNGRLLEGARNEAIYWAHQSGDEGLARQLESTYFRSEDILEGTRRWWRNHFDQVVNPQLQTGPRTDAARNRIWTEALNIRDENWMDTFNRVVDNYDDITRQAREIVTRADAGVGRQMSPVVDDILSGLTGRPHIPSPAEMADSQVPMMEDLIYQTIDQARNRATEAGGGMIDRMVQTLVDLPQTPTATEIDEIILGIADESPTYRAGVPDEVVDAVQTYVDELKPRINATNMIAAQVGDLGAEFSFHNYGNKHNVDTVTGLMFQYPFFYTESYRKHLIRLYDQPYLLAGYQKFENLVNQLNADMPVYYRDQLRLPDVMGQPMYANVRALIDPMANMMDTFHNETRERTTIGEAEVGRWVAELNQAGMSTNAIFGSMLAVVALTHNNDTEATLAHQGYRSAVSRMSVPITAHARNIPGLEDIIPPGGVALAPSLRSMAAEYAPGVLGGPEVGAFARGRQLYSGAADAGPYRWHGFEYDRDRIGYTMAQLMDEGEISRKDATWAAYAMSGETYDTALQQHYEDRLMPTVSSWLMLRAGARGEYQMEFISMWDAITTIMDNKDQFPSTEAYRETLDAAESRWPYSSLIMMLRRSPELRDEALSWDVLSRMEPNEQDPFGTDDPRNEVFQDLRSQFYDDRGDVQEWERRGTWMEMMEVLAHELDYPTADEQAEWDEARRQRRAMVDTAQQRFGADIVQVEQDWFEPPEGRYPEGRRPADERPPPRLQEYWDFKRQTYASSDLLTRYYGPEDVTMQQVMEAAEEAQKTAFQYRYEQQGIDIYGLRGEAAEILKQEDIPKNQMFQEYGEFMDLHPEIAESYAFEESLWLREAREKPSADKQVLDLADELLGEGIWDAFDRMDELRDMRDRALTEEEKQTYQDEMDGLERDFRLDDLYELIRIVKGRDPNTPEEEFYFLGREIISTVWPDRDKRWEAYWDADKATRRQMWKDDPFFEQYKMIADAASLPDEMRYDREFGAAEGATPLPMQTLMSPEGMAQAMGSLPEEVQRTFNLLPSFLQRSILEAYAAPDPPEVPIEIRKRLVDGYLARLPAEVRVAIENLGVPKAVFERIVALDYQNQRRADAAEEAAPATTGARPPRPARRWGGGGGGRAPAAGAPAAARPTDWYGMMQLLPQAAVGELFGYWKGQPLSESGRAALEAVFGEVGFGDFETWLMYLQQLYQKSFPTIAQQAARPPSPRSTNWLPGVRRY